MNQEKNFTITVLNASSGQYEKVPVTEEVYRCYRRSYWNEEHGDYMFHEKELTESEFKAINTSEDAEYIINGCPNNSAETVFLQKHKREQVLAAIENLPKKYRDLIYMLFFRRLSERKCSKICGLPQRTISDRKQVALRLLRKKLSEFSNFL